MRERNQQDESEDRKAEIVETDEKEKRREKKGRAVGEEWKE